MAGNSGKKIAELRQGDKVNSVFSLQYKKPVTDYKKGKMFEFKASDKTGQITVKYWGGADPVEIQKAYEPLEKDCVVRVVGTASEYRGSLEIAVNPDEGGSVKRLAEGEYDVKELIGTREDIEQLLQKLRKETESVGDKHYSALLRSVFDEKFTAEFSKCPASISLHSSEIGGLIFHTMNVVSLCKTAWENYKEMDRDLLLTGAILHDVGKVDSFKITTNIGQTDEGSFLGHVIVGMNLVQKRIEAIPDYPEDKKLKILHIILSHHGKKEWGSPVEPSFPEALAIHYADDFDAKLEYIIGKRREASTDDSWIWDWRMKRMIYLD